MAKRAPRRQSQSCRAWPRLRVSGWSAHRALILDHANLLPRCHRPLEAEALALPRRGKGSSCPRPRPPWSPSSPLVRKRLRKQDYALMIKLRRRLDRHSNPRSPRRLALCPSMLTCRSCWQVAPAAAAMHRIQTTMELFLPKEVQSTPIVGLSLAAQPTSGEGRYYWPLNTERIKGSPALRTKDLVAHTTVEREGEQPRDCPGLCCTVQYTVRQCSIDSIVTAPTVTAKGRCVLKPTTRNRVVDFLSFFLNPERIRLPTTVKKQKSATTKATSDVEKNKNSIVRCHA